MIQISLLFALVASDSWVLFAACDDSNCLLYRPCINANMTHPCLLQHYVPKCARVRTLYLFNTANTAELKHYSNNISGAYSSIYLRTLENVQKITLLHTALTRVFCSKSGIYISFNIDIHTPLFHAPERFT